MNANKTWRERAVHALIFEVLAVALTAPVLSWVMKMPMAHAGLLTLMISLVAMTWNMIFNSLFDRIERHWRLVRTMAMRMVHATAFEAGLVAIVVPLVAWWLDMSLLDALILDIGLLLFFLPYTFVFNLVYDKLRASLLRKRMFAG
ncbi:bacterial Transmembrane Pair family protein [Collimonas fungivorans]|uniref:Bacterial Transmembrane Pair family protein n=1 Tax=Collimonas fungivorans TaxID=158899 RepID=A0A127P9M0_9BURK|nr:multidrug/biocide efflux PACE transporter [Collimonas fungivorans]AMO94448.1 bacterial Transmembrane Pair family protein [Collimonas fungivorans]